MPGKLFLLPTHLLAVLLSGTAGVFRRLCRGPSRLGLRRFGGRGPSCPGLGLCRFRGRLSDLLRLRASCALRRRRLRLSCAFALERLLPHFRLKAAAVCLIAPALFFLDDDHCGNAADDCRRKEKTERDESRAVRAQDAVGGGCRELGLRPFRPRLGLGLRRRLLREEDKKKKSAERRRKG